jgi:hypothetical protein
VGDRRERFKYEYQWLSEFNSQWTKKECAGSPQCFAMGSRKISPCFPISANLFDRFLPRFETIFMRVVRKVHAIEQQEIIDEAFG